MIRANVLVITRRLSSFVFAVSTGWGGGFRRWQTAAREFSVRVVERCRDCEECLVAQLSS